MMFWAKVKSAAVIVTMASVAIGCGTAGIIAAQEGQPKKADAAPVVTKVDGQIIDPISGDAKARTVEEWQALYLKAYRKVTDKWLEVVKDPEK
jgi:hypothetical protein